MITECGLNFRWFLIKLFPLRLVTSTSIGYLLLRRVWIYSRAFWLNSASCLSFLIIFSPRLIVIVDILLQRHLIGSYCYHLYCQEDSLKSPWIFKDLLWIEMEILWLSPDNRHDSPLSCHQISYSIEHIVRMLGTEPNQENKTSWVLLGVSTCCDGF